MRPTDRQTAIADVIRQQARVSVESLASMFSASPETIRRDLTALARSGRILKVHGGAVMPRGAGEGPFAERMALNVAAKRQIAKLACQLISPGESLFIDTGSTTLILAEEMIKLNHLTVITNSAEIARVLSAGNSTIDVFLLGGAYRGGNRQTCGAMVIDQLAHFRADRALLTAGAASAEAGFTDYNAEEAEVARAMIRRAGHAMLLVDSEKFGKLAPFSVAGFDTVDCLVCEQAPTGEFGNALSAGGVEVVH